MKQQIRRQALAARGALSDRESRSQLVLAKALELPELGAADTILIYVDCRSEVQTRAAIEDLLAGGKTIVVPWCRDDQHLGLFHLLSIDELTPGRFGILEPNPHRLSVSYRHVAAARLDLLLLPGVAFDRQGGRLGHGRAYFDRLLAETRPDAVKVGLAFESQLVAEAPMGDHDVRLDVVVTEDNVFRVR